MYNQNEYNICDFQLDLQVEYLLSKPKYLKMIFLTLAERYSERLAERGYDCYDYEYHLDIHEILAKIFTGYDAESLEDLEYYTIIKFCETYNCYDLENKFKDEPYFLSIVYSIKYYIKKKEMLEAGQKMLEYINKK